MHVKDIWGLCHNYLLNWRLLLRESCRKGEISAGGGLIAFAMLYFLHPVTHRFCAVPLFCKLFFMLGSIHFTILSPYRIFFCSLQDLQVFFKLRTVFLNPIKKNYFLMVIIKI